MRSEIQYYFSLAKDAALSKADRRQFLLGACAIRGDSKVVSAANGPTFAPNPKAHAEARICKKLDFGAVIYVVRIAKQDDGYVMARPCAPCRMLLKSMKVKKVYYSVSRDQYGIWFPDTDAEHVLYSCAISDLDI